MENENNIGIWIFLFACMFVAIVWCFIASNNVSINKKFVDLNDCTLVSIELKDDFEQSNTLYGYIDDNLFLKYENGEYEKEEITIYDPFEDEKEIILNTNTINKIQRETKKHVYKYTNK